jgi:L-lactate dehydrogenase complex protein LldF
MERIAWKVWKRASLSRKMMNMGNQKLKNWVVNKAFKGWTTNRDDLNFAGKTFNEQWKERRNR